MHLMPIDKQVIILIPVKILLIRIGICCSAKFYFEDFIDSIQFRYICWNINCSLLRDNSHWSCDGKTKTTTNKQIYIKAHCVLVVLKFLTECVFAQLATIACYCSLINLLGDSEKHLRQNRLPHAPHCVWNCAESNETCILKIMCVLDWRTFYPLVIWYSL